LNSLCHAAPPQGDGFPQSGQRRYLPTDPRMRASLIIYGPGARSGAKTSLARMIDLPPSIAGLPKLKLPQAEGKPFKELLNSSDMK
jgi:hypothetical protein